VGADLGSACHSRRVASPRKRAGRPLARLGRHSQLPKLALNEIIKAGIATTLRAARGRRENFDLPSHFDDIILGHEI
jgi:hypothetical protein